jgi:hypothetical protein
MMRSSPVRSRKKITFKYGANKPAVFYLPPVPFVRDSSAGEGRLSLLELLGLAHKNFQISPAQSLAGPRLSFAIYFCYKSVPNTF